jgi:prepilin-type N-terminal cleavage/methylation domain-containing protein
MTRAKQGRRRGFTLVEAMASVVVLGVLASIASYLIVDSVDKCMDAMTAAQLHSELSVALDRAERELRKIDLDAGAGGIAPDITSVTSTLIQWEDTGNDAYEVSQSGSTVRLKVDGGTLATLLTDVTAFTVAVYNESNASIGLPLAGAGCDPIRRIQVDVTVTRNGVSESLRAKAFIRSTMEGDT